MCACECCTSYINLMLASLFEIALEIKGWSKNLTVCRVERFLLWRLTRVYFLVLLLLMILRYDCALWAKCFILEIGKSIYLEGIGYLCSNFVKLLFRYYSHQDSLKEKLGWGKEWMTCPYKFVLLTSIKFGCLLFLLSVKQLSKPNEECNWGSYARGALYALQKRGNTLTKVAGLSLSLFHMKHLLLYLHSRMFVRTVHRSGLRYNA